MAKKKKNNSSLVDKLMKYYVPVAVLLIVGIIGSLYLNFSQAAISTDLNHDQALKINAARKEYNECLNRKKLNPAIKECNFPYLVYYKHIECLNQIAEQWSQKMAYKKELDHNPYLASSVKTKCGSYKYVGENVGYGSTSGSVFDAFMRSAPHKANILDRDYTVMGVGVYWDSTKKIMWVTQVFAECASNCSSGPWAAGVRY